MIALVCLQRPLSLSVPALFLSRQNCLVATGSPKDESSLHSFRGHDINLRAAVLRSSPEFTFESTHPLEAAEALSQNALRRNYQGQVKAEANSQPEIWIIDTQSSKELLREYCLSNLTGETYIVSSCGISPVLGDLEQPAV